MNKKRERKEKREKIKNREREQKKGWSQIYKRNLCRKTNYEARAGAKAFMPLTLNDGNIKREGGPSLFTSSLKGLQYSFCLLGKGMYVYKLIRVSLGEENDEKLS